MPFVIALHVIVCLLLIGLVLIQRGRGGGLLESFSGVESMFGTKTNAFLTKITAVLSILFFITCLGLAVLSVRQSRSLMRRAPVSAPVAPAPAAAPSQPQAAEALPAAPAAAPEMPAPAPGTQAVQ